MPADPPADAERRAYLRGEELWGDDLDQAGIDKWYEEERGAYADLGAADFSSYRYGYHALNARHGFRYLPEHRFRHALGFGSAWAEEYAPIASRVDRLTVVEPGELFRRTEIHGVPAEYVTPVASGDLAFEDGTFDLVTCLGALHHIPNVSHVVRELRRCLRPEGFVLLREPIVSMGDWSVPRRGLTPNERGIPLDIFRGIVRRAGFRLVHESLCVFPGVARLWKRFGRSAFGDPMAVELDALCCWLLRWNVRYHATRSIHKLRPSSVYFVLTAE